MSRTPRCCVSTVGAVVALLAPASAAAAVPPAPVTSHQVLEIARAELARDVREVPAGSDRGPRIRLYTRSATEVYYPAPWCAYFVSWVTREAGVPIGPWGMGLPLVDNIAIWAKRTGRWHQRPRPSDLLVLDEHVGIVEMVFADRTLISIEGNRKDRLMRVRRTWGEALGYARVISRAESAASPAPGPPPLR